MKYIKLFEGIHRTDKELEDIAKKYTSIKDFVTQDRQTYNSCVKRSRKVPGFLDRVTSHMTNLRKESTDNELMKAAKKYKKYSSLVADDTFYRSLLRKGQDFFNKATEHIEDKPTGEYKYAGKYKPMSEEELQELANKYKYTSDFRSENKKAWDDARNKGILDKITLHMYKQRPVDKNWNDTDTEILINYLEDGFNTEDICKLMNLSHGRVLAKINRLKDSNKISDELKNKLILRKHTNSKLIEDEDISKIIKLYEEGKTFTEIARNIKKSTDSIKKNNRFK